MTGAKLVLVDRDSDPRRLCLLSSSTSRATATSRSGAADASFSFAVPVMKQVSAAPMSVNVVAARSPAMLTRDEAAAYVGVSVTLWDEEVANGMWPPPIKRGRKGTKRTWSVRAIDERIAELDRKAAIDAKQNGVDAPAMTEQMNAALERMMRARRG